MNSPPRTGTIVHKEICSPVIRKRKVNNDFTAVVPFALEFPSMNPKTPEKQQSNVCPGAPVKINHN
jgi:hypothetical protein